jgi:hypothetical protein
MAGFPGFSDIVATTIDNRSGKIADNVTKNNAILTWLKKAGNVKKAAGGDNIFQEFSFAENGNFGWYSGFDPLPMGSQDVLSGAVYQWKQAACPVVMSGLEKLKNSSTQKIIDLMESRLSVAESTMANKIAEGLYSNGTGSGGRTITGLQAVIADVPTVGTYGGVDRSVWSFWRNQITSGGTAAAQGQAFIDKMNTTWASCVRGMDRPKLILADTTFYLKYAGSLQSLIRFTNQEQGDVQFASLKFMDADVVLDGAIGGFAPGNHMYFINPKYMFFRPHEDRNMVALSPENRVPYNQDAEAQILAWAGNLTCSGAQFQGALLT